MDRNLVVGLLCTFTSVALRKESVDRNSDNRRSRLALDRSLSARRAWIEIPKKVSVIVPSGVALRKESVDRNA